MGRALSQVGLTNLERVALDDLRDANFDIPWERERSVRVERLGRGRDRGYDGGEDRPERVERLDPSSSAM